MHEKGSKPEEWRAAIAAAIKTVKELLELDRERSEALEVVAARLSKSQPLEARNQVRALHRLVDQTDLNDPIGNALSRVGLARRPECP